MSGESISPAGDSASGTGLDDLCAPFLATLSVDGLSISVFARGGGPSTVCVTDATAARLEELHFELGEGPFWDVLRTGRMVSVPNVAQTAATLWPVLSAAIIELDVGAIFGFPMALGATTIGVVGMHRRTPGELSTLEVARAASLAALTTAPAIRLAIDKARAESLPAEAVAPEMRRVVLQATGMIIAQLGVNGTESFARLRGYAFATGRSVQDVAADVVARRLDFRDLGA